MFRQTHIRKVNRWNARPSNRLIRRIPNQEFVFMGDAASHLTDFQGTEQGEANATSRLLRNAAYQHSERVPTEQNAAPEVPVVSKAGIRSRDGWILLAGMAAVMILVLLFKVGSIGMTQSDTQAREKTRHDLKLENAELTSALALWEKSAQVRYEAVKLGMVDADGVKRVVITLP